ncbi:DUF6221 family protein [Paractinoplanes atraurantiacus]|uniref:Uncharacterized protein n=1 Tax=Paractinoplanes atraurantiacus TaxID=1036182 RepID=A0A285GZN3_9ACTN|nr:DUF6221 family protein [Actinoplanes atraurantiacus]SNY28982.1 hypothetical protein SAMN05421748_103170 [Actinoplanes atraurantiacus]
MTDPTWRTALNPRTAWLKARLDEDERKIEAMEREEKRVQTAPVFQGHPKGWLAGVEIFVSPTRWRAEVEAKRRLLEWCIRLDPGDGLGGLMAYDARKIESWLAMSYIDCEGYSDLWPWGPHVER